MKTSFLYYYNDYHILYDFNVFLILKTKFALFVQNIYYLGFLIETKIFS